MENDRWRDSLGADLRQSGRLVDRRSSRRAIESEYHRPEHYHNLGEVFLLANRRADAVKAFNQALSWNPNFEASSDCLRRLGVRKPPVVPALPRSHPINVMLGKALRGGRKSRPVRT